MSVIFHGGEVRARRADHRDPDAGDVAGQVRKVNRGPGPGRVPDQQIDERVLKHGHRREGQAVAEEVKVR